MKFLYMGFSHETTGVRLYSFEGVASQGIRKDFLVTADIALLTKHRVRIQDGPMMCLQLLESSAETEPQLEFLVLTEADMLNHVRAKAAEKATKKRAKRPFHPVNAVAVSMAWGS
ncbi:MAG TPA: hypothetical protein VEU62_14040 [Bryobacterales bacterium]|nr:hypothetical protein [Bryobacterales bacterium]